jgi:hypothetical protein
LCDESGSLRRFLNIYLDGEDVRFLDNLATPVADGAEIARIKRMERIGFGYRTIKNSRRKRGSSSSAATSD